MPQVRGILVHLETQDVSGAGTDDHLYVGVVGRGGGREFPLDVRRFDDFKEGANVRYLLGTIWGPVPPGVRKPRESEPGERNDPGQFQMELAQVDYVYLRKTGTRKGEGDDAYALRDVEVMLYGQAPPERRTFSSSNVWLANEYGHQVWLRERP